MTTRPQALLAFAEKLDEAIVSTIAGDTGTPSLRGLERIPLFVWANLTEEETEMVVDRYERAGWEIEISQKRECTKSMSAYYIVSMKPENT